MNGAQHGYLLSEELHNQIMRGIDSLRFMEGMVSTACSAKVTPCFDLEDLAGYLQLLLSQTREPLKGLEYGPWLEAERAAKDYINTLSGAESKLIEWFRKMQADDRAHLSRFAQVLAGVS